MGLICLFVCLFGLTGLVVVVWIRMDWILVVSSRLGKLLGCFGILFLFSSWFVDYGAGAGGVYYVSLVEGVWGMDG